MAAREDQLESLVRECGLVHGALRFLRSLQEASLCGKSAIAADAVDRAVARRGHQPGARVGRCPGAWPTLGGDRERLLGGFLGEIEVAEEADQ